MNDDTHLWDKTAFGAWLKRLRDATGMTQPEVAAALIPPAEPRSLRRWENAGDIPNGLYLVQLLSLYGVELSEPIPLNAPRPVPVELRDIRSSQDATRADVRKILNLLRKDGT